MVSFERLDFCRAVPACTLCRVVLLILDSMVSRPPVVVFYEAFVFTVIHTRIPLETIVSNQGMQ